MKKGKKGIISEPMLAILAVVALLATASVFYGYIKYMQEGRDYAKCKASVLLSDKVRTGELVNVRTEERIGTDCPKHEVDVKWKDVKPKGGLSSQQRTKYLLAEEMKTCWEKMGGPEKFRPFNDDWWKNKEKFCIVCTDIIFDEKTQERVPNITSFNKFLVEKNVKGRDYTYSKLFTGSDFEGDPELLADGAIVINPETDQVDGTISDKLSTQEEYVALYSITKKGLWKRAFGGIGGGLVGGGIAVAVLMVLPVPGSRIAAASLASALVMGGTTAGAYKGLVWGTEGLKYTREVNILPQQVIGKNLECGYLYT